MISVFAQREDRRIGLALGAILVLGILILSGCTVPTDKTSDDDHGMMNGTSENMGMNEEHTNSEDMMDDHADDMNEAKGDENHMDDMMDTTSSMSEDRGMMNEEDGHGMMGDEASEVTFNISGKNFVFMMDGKESPELHVKKGQKVKIVFTAESGFHDWVVDEFNTKTERVRDGGTTSVEFVADKAGTFEYYCSVGQHRANGMKGNLIVE